MKIRVKSVIIDGKEKFVYEVDDEKGNKIEINISYLELAIKILNEANNITNIRNSYAFEKFIVNLKRATRYADKLERKVIETPNIIHKNQDLSEAEEYRKKSIKYDRKAQALFSLHNGWYENFVSIIEEIKEVIEENYAALKDIGNDDKDLLYVASRIDGILDNYRKKQKTKTL